MNPEENNVPQQIRCTVDKVRIYNQYFMDFSFMLEDFCFFDKLLVILVMILGTNTANLSMKKISISFYSSFIKSLFDGSN